MAHREAVPSPWLTRRTFGWALYDVASSTYAALVPPFFGLYFVALAGAGNPAAGAWGAVAGVSLVVAGVLSPLAGARADRTGHWLGILALATAVCVVAVLLLPAAASHGLLPAAAAFLIAQVGYTLATSMYDSYVVDIAPASHRGRVSGIGWALGLLGGIAAIVGALWLMRGVPPAAQVQRLGDAFVLCGVLFAVLALPGLAGLRGLRAVVPSVPTSGAWPGASLRAVGATLREWRRHRVALRVLTAFFLINDVMVTIVFFIAIVVRDRFGLDVEGVLWLSLLFHVIAIPSTVAFGMLADRGGARRSMAVMCTLLAGAILLLAFGRAAWSPVLAIVLLGLVFASIQAVFRSLYAGLVPLDKAAELFGFNSIAGRLSAALGPLLFGAAVAVLGSQTWALCLLLVPLAAGVALLFSADLPPAAADGGFTPAAARAR